MRAERRTRLLIVDAGEFRAAIPLESVRETMRPLPIVALGAAPHFVLGLSVIRGESVPVVDLGALLGANRTPSIGRFVTLVAASRPVALAVRAVNGVSPLDESALAELPPLVSHAAGGVVEALGLHDAALLLVLKTTRLLPADLHFGPEAAT